MGQALLAKPKYECGNEENNNIGVKGCEHLSKTNWPKLDKFNLRIDEDMQRGTKYSLKVAKI